MCTCFTLSLFSIPLLCSCFSYYIYFSLYQCALLRPLAPYLVTHSTTYFSTCSTIRFPPIHPPVSSGEENTVVCDGCRFSSSSSGDISHQTRSHANVDSGLIFPRKLGQQQHTTLIRISKHGTSKLPRWTLRSGANSRAQNWFQDFLAKLHYTKSLWSRKFRKM